MNGEVRMTFEVEFALPHPGAFVARRVDAQTAPPSLWALLGGHMIRSVKRPNRQGETPRDDLFVFLLDLDPALEAPKPGDALDLTLLDDIAN